MKKMIAILFAVLILLLAGCSAAPDANDFSGNENGSIQQGYPAMIGLDKYNAFITKVTNSKELPNNFIHLDALQCFGPFYGFIPTPQFPAFYKYTFMDANGNDLNLEITHVSQSNSISTSEYVLATVTPDMTSMLKKGASETMTAIVRNGVEYHYSTAGHLSHIVWEQNGIYYKVHSISQYSGSSVISRLLSIDETEASAAFAEIKQALNSK